MRWFRRGLYALLALFGLVILAVAGGYFWLRTSLPQTSGLVATAGIAAPVEIIRDDDGIVTIRAAGEADAWFALGYAHAQDRLFQMDFMRRLTAGRLSEVVGEATLSTDKLMRILGLYRLADVSFAMQPPEMQTALESYSAGVNAFLAHRPGALPPEFALLRYRPEPWQPADSLAWGRLLAFQLSGNWWDELLRYRLSQELTSEELEALWPAVPADGRQAASQPLHETRRIGSAPAMMPTSPLLARPHGASNSFVVDGKRSSSGRPLLANDPHLSLQTPSQWYLVRIETPTLRLAGATAPGVPLMVIGHNGHAAWSFTTTHGDTQDLFLERPSAGDPARYETPAGPISFLTRQETIKVRGEADFNFAVRQSRHGPIISDAPSAEWTDETQVLALAWPGFEVDDGTAAALFRMNRAATATEMMEALQGFHSPQQNAIFADGAGNVGFVAAGRVPMRKALQATSQMPAAGWTGAFDWTGYLPFAALPQSVNPPGGWIATANNRIVGDDYPHFLAARWEPPYRYRRIAERIAALPQHSVETLADIQTDTLSHAARDLVPVLLEPFGDETGLDAPQRGALALLRSWDFRVTREQAAPLLFTTWLVELNRTILQDELGELFADYAAGNLVEIGTLVGAASPFCDDSSTPAPESCADAVRRSLAAAIARLVEAYGADPGRWRWGDAHRARLGHAVFDRVPVLGDLLHPAIETDGDNFTVNRATPRIRLGSVSYPDVHGPGLRAVFDFADLDRSQFIIAGGQSGNPLSPHYRDLVPRWRDGNFLQLSGQGNNLLTLMPPER